MTSVPTSGGDEAPSERQDFALAIDDAPVRYVFAGDGGFTRVAVPRAGEGRKSRRYLRGLPWLRRITRGGDGPAPDLVHYWNISYLPLEQIRPATAPVRRQLSLENLEGLAASIRERGMLQPLIVRRLAEGRYELVSGYRRWLAAGLAEQAEAPALVMGQLGKDTAIELSLIENLQRSELTPIEEALAFHTLISLYGRTHAQLAATIGKSRSQITNILRLLSLPPQVQRLIEDGSLGAGHARALVGHPEAERLAERIVAEGLTARAAERLAGGVGESPDPPAASAFSVPSSESGEAAPPGEPAPAPTAATPPTAAPAPDGPAEFDAPVEEVAGQWAAGYGKTIALAPTASDAAGGAKAMAPRNPAGDRLTLQIARLLGIAARYEPGAEMGRPRAVLVASSDDALLAALERIHRSLEGSRRPDWKSSISAITDRSPKAF